MHYGRLRNQMCDRHSHITLAKLNSRRADCNPPMNIVIVPQKPIPCVKCSVLTKFFSMFNETETVGTEKRFRVFRCVAAESDSPSMFIFHAASSQSLRD